MNTTPSLKNFQFVDRHPGYDKANNPLRRTVAELTPVGIVWTCDSAQKSIQAIAGIGAVPLADMSGIAVFEGPYDDKNNRAYIVNCDGSIRAQVGPLEPVRHAMFYDVMYLNGRLTFLASISDHDVQVWVSETDGAILQVREFR